MFMATVIWDQFTVAGGVANLFVDKLIDFLNRFSKEMGGKRFKLHRQLCPILKVSGALK